jgi:hypothetical protein
MCDPALSVEFRDAENPLIERRDHLVDRSALLPADAARVGHQCFDPFL